MKRSERNCVHCGAPLGAGSGSQACARCRERANQETGVVASAPARELPASARETSPGNDSRLDGSFVLPLDETDERPTGGKLVTGERVGRYVLESELGRGGMGIVYCARDTQLKRPVAIKMILDLRLAGEALLRRFQLEASAAARLRHPGIVQVYEVGEHEGKPYIVMELVEGESLEALMTRAPVAPRKLAEIVRGVALALAHAHEHGIVHRDVKPENVIVDREGRPHLMDFGLAREIGGSERITVTGQALGTPAYMSPEQASGDPSAQGPASDVYALGALLYRAIAGKPPFEASSVQGLLKKILFEEPVALREKHPAVHRDLETIVHRCLAKEPARRYASATALAEDLGRFLEGDAIAARPVGRVEATVVWARRNRALAAAVSALVLGAIGTLAAFIAFAAYERKAEARREDARLEKKARDEAQAASKRFFAAAEEPAPPGEEARRRRGDRLLALGLKSLEAWGRLRALVPDDEVARDAAYRSACALGQVALDAEQWSVATAAYEEAAAIVLSDRTARDLLSKVENARTRVARERRAAVQAILAEAASGALERRPEGHEDALFALTAYREPETVAMIASALDGVTARLREARRAVYLAAAAPSPDEARAGAKRIEGVEEALEKRTGLDPEAKLDAASREQLARVERRLEDRETRATRDQNTPSRDLHRILAAEQERRVGAEGFAVAKLACEALGRIGIREGAVEPLGRYLAAEEDQLRVLAALEALCRLGGGKALAHVLRGRETFGRTGIFSSRIRAILSRSRGESTDEPTSAAAFLRRGTFRQEIGDQEGALADLRRAVELAPGDAHAWHRLGGTKLGRGDVEGAIADLTHALELDPTLSGAWHDRGRAYELKGDLDRALDEITKATEIEPRDANAWCGLGNLRQVRGEVAAALAAYAHAIELSPLDARYWTNRASARLAAGDRVGASSDATRAIELDPTRSEAWGIRADVRESAGDWDGCFADYERGLQLDPANPILWLNRGCARLDRGDWDGAIADAGQVLKLSPGETKALFNRGIARHMTRDLEGALADLSSVIEARPRHAMAYVERGLVKADKGDQDGAEADLSRAVELAPSSANAWAQRGRQRTGRDRAGAEADLTKALELEPANTTYMIWRALVRREAGDRKGALADVTRATEVTPADPAAWCGRAEMRRGLGDDAGAIEDATRAIELDPRVHSGWHTRGLARAARGDFEGAEADLTRAVEILPRDFQVWWSRGLARKKGGDRKGAVADLERALELDPNGPDAPSARATLEELRSKGE